MPFAAEIPKKKKPTYFDNYSGFADSPALSVQGGGVTLGPFSRTKDGFCTDVYALVTSFERLFDERI
jgi:hypothetical protein